MSKRIWVMVLGFLGLAIGYAPLQAGGAQGDLTGKEVPMIISGSFASKELIPGDTWKVYLKASDSDGEMRYIVSEVYQPGWGDYPISRTRIRAENRRELDGYIYLNTLVPGGYAFLNFYTFRVTVQIQDKAGNFSKPVEFPVTFNARAIQDQPPAGVFKENDLGPILVQLHPFDVGGGDQH